MRLNLASTWLALIVWSVAIPLQAEDGSKPPARKSGLAWFTNYNADSFRKLPAANRALDLSNLHYELLDAAVFHETNRRRQRQALPPLSHQEKARQMARLQSQSMAEGQFVGHENPSPAKKTLPDRARVVSLRFSFLAENVASAFGRRYQSGQKFYVREESGRKVYSLTPNGPIIPMHTYLSFAEALLDEWMASPGHRQNILHKSSRFLGCACESGEDDAAMAKFYCTQVFYAPPPSQ